MREKFPDSILPWVSKHPLQFLLRLLFLILQLGLNSLFFISVFWAPLNFSYRLVFLLGSVFGSGVTALWIRQQAAVIRGEEKAARKLRWLGLSVPAVVILIGGVTFFQLSALGTISPLAESYTEAYDELWELMDRHYPYFEQKNINWEAAYREYYPEIEAAETKGDFFRAVDDLLNTLPDGHTELSSPKTTFSGLRVFGCAGLYQGEALVTGVGLTAEEFGLEVGDKLLEIDGQSIPEAVREWETRIPPSSTPHHYQKLLYLYLLSAFDEDLTLKYEKPDGSVHTAVLEWNREAWRKPETGSVISSQELPSGVGVIRIRNFNLANGLGMIREFDTVLNEFLDAPGIILDVRNNGGGFSVLADLAAGRFFLEPVVYGEEFYRSRLPQHFWRKSIKYRIIPRGKIYTGPVVVITNAFTFSSADTFVAAMTHENRAVTVGRPTAGATGNPITVHLPGGGRARFSTGDFRLPNGISLEGIGLEPDIPVTWTREDLILGRDPDLDAAEDYLLSIEN